MPSNDLQPVNLGSIARGAAIELFEKNIAKIAANIADTSTPAEAKRTLVIRLVFEPDRERQGIDVTTTAEVKLAATERHSSRAYLAKGTDGASYLFPVDPRQAALFEPPQPEERVLEFGLPATPRQTR